MLATQVRTLGDLLTGHHRVVLAQISQLEGCTYDKRGAALTHWLRRYADAPVTDQGESCGQRHYTVVHADFVLAVVAVQVCQ